jgi:predicted esterase YcpF (UPF0227 family)
MNNQIAILYIPGFNGDSNSSTYRYFKKNLTEFNTYCLEYDNINPLHAESQLTSQIDNYKIKYENIALIGNSLGGYWANFFSQKYNLPCVLINPSLFPRTNLIKYNIEESHLVNYRDSRCEPAIRLIFLGIHDEVVDYQQTVSFFKYEPSINFMDEAHKIRKVDYLTTKTKNFMHSIFNKPKSVEEIYFNALTHNLADGWRLQTNNREILRNRKSFLNSKFIFSEKNINKLIQLNKQLEIKEKHVCFQYIDIHKSLDSINNTDYKTFDVNCNLSIELFSDTLFNNDEELCGNPYEVFDLMVFEYERHESINKNQSNEKIYADTMQVLYRNRFNHEPLYKPLAALNLCDTMQQIILYSKASLEDLIITDCIWIELKLELQSKIEIIN